jgi:hypothetical protein
MHEEISKHIAALNAAWQRYGRAIEQQLDTVPMDALNRDFVAAREVLAACGIAESMLVYDSATMTFFLPTDIPADDRWGDDDLDSGEMQLV